MNNFGENWLFDSFRMGYDRPRRGKIYLSYLIIGAASLLSIYVLIIVPILWAMGVMGLKRLTLKSWVASILGILTPYWIKLGIGVLY
ncbi:MAG: hypothetical protein Q4F34_05985 [Prevotellaceae bacterium]|nr:hypothetical protein [Prevotellaceae bacterium]